MQEKWPEKFALFFLTNLPGDSDLRIMFERYCLMRLLKKQLLILVGYTPFGYFKTVSLPVHTHSEPFCKSYTIRCVLKIFSKYCTLDSFYNFLSIYIIPLIRVILFLTKFPIRKSVTLFLPLSHSPLTYLSF